MYLLSAQAREMISEAVAALNDPAQRVVWQSWAASHPRLRLPEGPIHDDEPPMSAEVAVVVLTALSQMETMKRNQRRAEPNISEDDQADLDNEITYIGSVTRLVQEAARG